jgi:GntR family transcriptional regulator
MEKQTRRESLISQFNQQQEIVISREAKIMTLKKLDPHKVVEVRINPATAAKGFAQLGDEGVLYKRRGIGMFVSPDARQRLLEERRERFFAEVVDPMVDEARVIGIPLDEGVARIQAAPQQNKHDSSGSQVPEDTRGGAQ